MSIFTKIMTKIMHGNVDRVVKMLEEGSGGEEWMEIKKEYEKKNITWTEFQKLIKEWKKQFPNSIISSTIDSYIATKKLEKQIKKSDKAFDKAKMGLKF